jgi:hypothetical protein
MMILICDSTTVKIRKVLSPAYVVIMDIIVHTINAIYIYKIVLYNLRTKYGESSLTYRYVSYRGGVSINYS